VCEARGQWLPCVPAVFRGLARALLHEAHLLVEFDDIQDDAAGLLFNLDELADVGALETRPGGVDSAEQLPDLRTPAPPPGRPAPELVAEVTPSFCQRIPRVPDPLAELELDPVDPEAVQLFETGLKHIYPISPLGIREEDAVVSRKFLPVRTVRSFSSQPGRGRDKYFEKLGAAGHTSLAPGVHLSALIQRQSLVGEHELVDLLQLI